MKHKGFTIVELILIMVVLGVLMTITAVGYGAWRERVASTEVKSNLTQLFSAMEGAKNFGSGYPTSITPDLYKPSDGVDLTYRGGDPSGFCVDAVSKARPSVRYYLHSYSGKEPQEGVCTETVPPGTPVMNPVVYFSDVTGTIMARIAEPIGMPVASYKFSYKVESGDWVSITPSNVVGREYQFIGPPLDSIWRDCTAVNCALFRIVAVGQGGLESAPYETEFYNGIWQYD
jgi:type II secretory pathway pseudopilin PulG